MDSLSDGKVFKGTLNMFNMNMEYALTFEAYLPNGNFEFSHVVKCLTKKKEQENLSILNPK